MRTVDAVVGRWEQIFPNFGINISLDTPNKHQKCPLCSKVKFRCDDAKKSGKGEWICVCGAGDGFSLLSQFTGRDFLDLAKEVDKIIGNTFDSTAVKERKPPDLADIARTRFKQLGVIRGTPGHKYLNSRGIFLLPRGGCKWSPGEWDNDQKKQLSCIYSIASNEFGHPIYKHETYINENGEKYDIERQKKMVKLKEFDGSVAIKLFEAKTCLGISEGIENSLSSASLYKMPVWACLTATILKKFRAPTGVKSLYIYADNDANGTGLAAAFECGNKNILSRNDVEKVIIRWPKSVNDFNDVLINGDKVLEWVLT